MLCDHQISRWLRYSITLDMLHDGVHGIDRVGAAYWSPDSRRLLLYVVPEGASVLHFAVAMIMQKSKSAVSPRLDVFEVRCCAAARAPSWMQHRRRLMCTLLRRRLGQRDGLDRLGAPRQSVCLLTRGIRPPQHCLRGDEPAVLRFICTGVLTAHCARPLRVTILLLLLEVSLQAVIDHDLSKAIAIA